MKYVLKRALKKLDQQEQDGHSTQIFKVSI